MLTFSGQPSRHSRELAMMTGVRRSAALGRAAVAGLLLGSCGCTALLGLDDFDLAAAKGAVDAGSTLRPILPGPSGAAPATSQAGGDEPSAPEMAAPTPGSNPRTRLDAGLADASAEPVAPPPALPPDPLLTPYSPSPLASSVPDCMVSNRRIAGKDDPTSMFSARGGYHGYAEWLEGTFGSCEGVQWIRLHVETSATSQPLELRYLFDDGTATGVGHAWPRGLPTGSYFDGPILLNPRVICGLLAVPGTPRAEWPLFGDFTSGTPSAHLIPGTLC
jgi:hypothetical protein